MDWNNLNDSLSSVLPHNFVNNLCTKDNLVIGIIVVMLIILWYNKKEPYRTISTSRTYDETILHPDDPRKLAEKELRYPKIYNLNNLRMNEIFSNHFSFLDQDTRVFRDFDKQHVDSIVKETDNQYCSTATDFTPICQEDETSMWN